MGILLILVDTPWAEPPTVDAPRGLTWEEASYLDLRHHLRPEVVQEALGASARAWPDWQQTLDLRGT